MGAPGVPWQAILRDRLTHRFVEIDATDGTVAAEAGLGYDASAYWYVHRGDAAFGRVGTLWKLQAGPLLPSSGASTPFDSGGLWHANIVTDPPLADPLDRRDFVRTNEHTCDDSLARLFVAWLETAFSSGLPSYVRGDVPAFHVHPIVLDRAKNEPRAWTWELRLVAAAVDASIIRPIGIVWSEADYEGFEWWIHESDTRLGVFEKEQLLARCRAVSTFTDMPIARLAEILETAPNA